MKTSLTWTLILFTLSLLILLPHVALAQAEQDGRPIVRLIYFRPSDRAAHPDIDTKVDTLIQDVQRFFADQMETHGFGRKTFLYETHANGKAVVHHVTGRYTDAHYRGFALGSGMWGEINHGHRFSETKDIYLVLTDLSSESYPAFSCKPEARKAAGAACGVAVGVETADSSGHALVPIGQCFNIRVIAHELGHVFGFVHDFRNDAYLMSHGAGPNDQNQLSYCAAEWLDVHPAFNTGGTFLPSNTTVKLSDFSVSQENTLHVQFEITDPDGLHQVQLMYYTSGAQGTLLLDFKGLNGATNSIVEFTFTQLTTTIQIQCVDINGSYFRTKYPLAVLESSFRDSSYPWIELFDKPGYFREVVQHEQHFIDRLSLPEGAKLRLGKGTLRDVTYSPDGTRLAVVSSIGIRIYDAHTYQELSLLTGPSFDSLSVVFSPDGKMLATKSNYFTRRLYLWDVETGSLLHTLSGPFTSARAIYAAFDAQTLISVWEDDTLRFWDIGTGSLTHTVSIPNMTRHSVVTLLPNKRILAKADTQSDETTLYNIDTGTLIRSFKGSNFENSSVFSDGQILAVVGNRFAHDWSSGGTTFIHIDEITAWGVDVWDVDTGNLIHTFPLHRRPDSIQLSPDRQIIALGFHSTVELRDIDTGRVLHTFTLHNKLDFSGAIDIVKFSPDGKTLICGGLSDILTLWDVSTGTPLHSFTGYTGGITSLALSPDGQRLASADLDLNLRLWDVNTGNLTYTLVDRNRQTHLLAFSPDGKILASAGAASSISLWDTETAQLSAELSGHLGSVASLEFSSDGQMLVSGDYNGAVAVWDVSNKTIRIGIIAYPSKLENVAFSPDGKIIASQMDIFWDQNVDTPGIRLWNATTGHLIQELDEAAFGISFSPVGNTLLLARGWLPALLDIGTDGNFTPRDTVMFDGSPEVAKFSPDGKTIATIEYGVVSYAGGGSTIALWDVETGNRLRTFAGHSGSASGYNSSLAFGPDGNTLASASSDGTILLWELAPSAAGPPQLPADVNGDGEVNIRDLVAVAAAIGQTGENGADVNGDRQVNIRDLVAVAAAIGEVAAAPAALRQPGAAHLTQKEVQHYLTQAQQAHLTDAVSLRGIGFLAQLLAAFTPKETALLPNYPNPFNPETWIPYQLAKPADVTLTIYDIQGRVVRDLDLGHQRTGMHQSKSRAAYWDGRNAVGEPVASGVYFYTLTAGEFSATRKLLIRK